MKCNSCHMEIYVNHVFMSWNSSLTYRTIFFLLQRLIEEPLSHSLYWYRFFITFLNGKQNSLIKNINFFKHLIHFFRVKTAAKNVCNKQKAKLKYYLNVDVVIERTCDTGDIWSFPNTFCITKCRWWTESQPQSSRPLSSLHSSLIVRPVVGFYRDIFLTACDEGVNERKLCTPEADDSAHRKRASLDSQTWFCWTVFQEKSRSSSSMERLRTVVPQRPTREHRRLRPWATRMQ